MGDFVPSYVNIVSAEWWDGRVVGRVEFFVVHIDRSQCPTVDTSRRVGEGRLWNNRVFFVTPLAIFFD